VERRQGHLPRRDHRDQGDLAAGDRPFRAIGKHIGTAIINGLIGIINIGIRGLNKVLGPRNLGPLGHTPDLRLGEITPIGAPKPGVTIHKRKPVQRWRRRRGPERRVLLGRVGDEQHQHHHARGRPARRRFVGQQIALELARRG
jgi:hypothetical protein